MKAVWIVAALALPATAQPPQRPVDEPKIRIVDRTTLDGIIRPGTLPKFGSLQIFWRIDVDVPPHAAVKSFWMPGYAPVVLQVTDGRCFQVDMDSGGSRLKSAGIVRVSCPPEQKIESPWPTPVPRPGMRYVGRAWDLDAWTEKRTGMTFLFQAEHQNRPPVAATSMRVLAIGALGLPDAPVTEVTLAGYIGRQLTLATISLYVPEVSAQPANGSRTRIVSSRSGDVLTSATGQRISSSTRRTYLIARAGRSAQLRAPWVDSHQPLISSKMGSTRAWSAAWAGR